jgi:hypothetical protein
MIPMLATPTGLLTTTQIQVAETRYREEERVREEE